MDSTQFTPELDQILSQMSEEEVESFLRDPRVLKILEATKCETSHDLEHHWPFNIDRQEEREGCIYCDKTKREVIIAVVNSRRQRRRAGKVPPKGSFPKPGEQTPFIKIRLEDLLDEE